MKNKCASSSTRAVTQYGGVEGDKLNAYIRKEKKLDINAQMRITHSHGIG